MSGDLPSATRFGDLLAELRQGLRLDFAVLISVAHNPSGKPGGETIQQTIERSLSSPGAKNWMGHYGEEYAQCKILILAPADKRADGEVSLGRSRGCDVQVANESVSKLHARIIFDAAAAEYSVVDEASRNGTYANGLQVSAGVKTAIWSGTHLSLGDAHFIFMDPPTLKMLANLDPAKTRSPR